MTYTKYFKQPIHECSKKPIELKKYPLICFAGHGFKNGSDHLEYMDVVFRVEQPVAPSALGTEYLWVSFNFCHRFGSWSILTGSRLKAY